MSAVTFRFGAYRLCSASRDDSELARAWTAADPDHAGRVAPEFWIEDGWLLFDHRGPVFFFKGVRIEPRVLEIHVQFGAGLGRDRLMTALTDGMEWLEANVDNVDELRFDSKNLRLIHFCEKRLGFTNADGKLSKRLIAEVRN